MNTEFENNAPFKGFSAFWWGLLGFVAFGALSMLAFDLTGEDEDSAYMKNSDQRLEIRRKVESEQRTAVAGFGLDLGKAVDVFASVSPSKSSKPALGTAAQKRMMEALMAAAADDGGKAEGDSKEGAKEPEGEGTSTAQSGGKKEGAKTGENEEKKEEDVFKYTLEPEIGLKWKQKEFKVKAGQQVELTLKNNDPTMQIHNLLIIKPGSTQKVGMLANQMMADPQGMAKNYIPNSPDVLHHTSLVQVGKSETLKFKAPDQPGDYPYICTFPGHWMLMQGKMIVE